MKKILIVDDEKDIRDLLKTRFELSGFEGLTAKDGKEALKIARHDQPSLIILDLVMPKMDGFETHKALKSDKRTKHIPIIAYTAQNPEIVAKKGIKALDIIDFVMKPFDARALMLMVQETLKNNRK